MSKHGALQRFTSLEFMNSNYHTRTYEWVQNFTLCDTNLRIVFKFCLLVNPILGRGRLFNSPSPPSTINQLKDPKNGHKTSPKFFDFSHFWKSFLYGVLKEVSFKKTITFISDNVLMLGKVVLSQFEISRSLLPPKFGVNKGNFKTYSFFFTLALPQNLPPQLQQPQPQNNQYYHYLPQQHPQLQQQEQQEQSCNE